MKFIFGKSRVQNVERELLKNKSIDQENQDTFNERVEFPFMESLLESRPDLTLNYIRDVLLDSNEYYEKNRDVKNIGFDAVEHYFRFGVAEKRSFCPAKKNIINKPSFDNRKYRKLFISSAPLTDGSFKYRCLYQSERYKDALVYCGKSSIVKKVKALFEVDEIIFSRPEPNDTSTYLLTLAKNIGVKVTLDYDDLLLPDSSHMLGHVRSSVSPYSAAKKSSFLKTNYFYLADKIISSTENIKSHLEFLGVPIEVRKNELLRSMLIDRERILQKFEESDSLKIIYLSGTATHRKDYSIIHGVLLKLAQEFGEKIELTFLGNTGVNINAFKMYLKKVNIISKVSFDEMLNVISLNHLALVPLESTVFNNAKSNIKFLECGSQGVPVISSNVDEFSEVIQTGKNGWICSSDEDWYKCIIRLLSDKSLLKTTSLNCFDTVNEATVLGENYV